VPGQEAITIRLPGLSNKGCVGSACRPIIRRGSRSITIICCDISLLLLAKEI
jgi:hypothetical protein